MNELEELINRCGLVSIMYQGVNESDMIALIEGMDKEVEVDIKKKKKMHINKNFNKTNEGFNFSLNLTIGD